ncbi:hypothetical protein H112_07325 [Trichophyton rubrum D6]|uniref:Uncharacterized protein n=2 Tax=Trichophyton rubrum TaxID=5551 RepID=F2SIF7_TRIRC|nr:uncharacterized protein TERG_02645 [Trichophyton rubrum CBS 118892]EZF11512.1 hypothetical protein H100_07352 [Trichophyton rubrum MR850]EZF38436.1 hypothetical protein H102_07313 [Trichophyton rubrum CBS 100081]EZF49027.1 hypothetical protein H103_07336 [Trichophyton rubrum CBS 288.86]EZF80944.1 hypothetical protein H110_07334 [Trichophyton rubrum MR1448]EZF91620.1 hypothetical protein H113_07387 [Trichophyton rubrum MR1459]EZG13274.1 hypothetical protein H107_07494 [Trichophyton rubrum C
MAVETSRHVQMVIDVRSIDLLSRGNWLYPSKIQSNNRITAADFTGKKWEILSLFANDKSNISYWQSEKLSIQTRRLSSLQADLCLQITVPDQAIAVIDLEKVRENVHLVLWTDCRYCPGILGTETSVSVGSLFGSVIMIVSFSNGANSPILFEVVVRRALTWKSVPKHSPDIKMAGVLPLESRKHFLSCIRKVQTLLWLRMYSISPLVW